MAKPITGTVHFIVNVTPFKAGEGHFMVQTVETGIVTYGATIAEARDLNGVANVMVVRRMKLLGREALDAFMAKNGIVDYMVGDQPGVAIPGMNFEPMESGLPLAA